MPRLPESTTDTPLARPLGWGVRRVARGHPAGREAGGLIARCDGGLQELVGVVIAGAD
jgi:hypothetical protein